ncbi:peptide ABC transporter permease [Bradyrhizobium sp. NAS80.1]|uniref:ABC transporter permease n=1 Tax=Bradyrhizobium sp. NAS80.1 TaxID=1680159 RepID=UPI00096A00ED|nr:ABC transporter permease [Bradyrhizobium sp. NAS80.1]OKO87685.1 peptide ABC transporter permease [Bradyrhizobium sp. NAS80.1]
MTDAALDPATVAPSALQRGAALARRLFRHLSFRIGFVIVALLVMVAVVGPLLHTADPTAMQMRFRFRPPSARFWMGTDALGRDILSRFVHGARLSLVIGLWVAILSGIAGTIFGVLSGYVRAIDSLVMRIMDALLAFPPILLAIGINAALGPQVHSVIIALSVSYIPRTARIVRASALVVRELDYVQAARISGASGLRIVLRHILPNSVGPLLVQLTFVFAYAILAEAALSFLGIGPPPPTPSWGNIIAEGRDYSVEAWWIMLFPGLGISLAALGMNLLGDGLRDVLDPRLKIEG